MRLGMLWTIQKIKRDKEPWKKGPKISDRPDINRKEYEAVVTFIARLAKAPKPTAL